MTSLANYADTEEVAKLLNIHPESVRRLIRKRELPAIKFGNKWIVDRVTLAQYAANYNNQTGVKAVVGLGLPLPDKKP